MLYVKIASAIFGQWITGCKRYGYGGRIPLSLQTLQNIARIDAKNRA